MKVSATGIGDMGSSCFNIGQTTVECLCIFIIKFLKCLCRSTVVNIQVWCGKMRPKLCSAFPGSTPENRTSVKMRTLPFSRPGPHELFWRFTLGGLWFVNISVFYRRGQSSKVNCLMGLRTTRRPGRRAFAVPSTRVQSSRRWWSELSSTSQIPTRCTAWSRPASRVGPVAPR